MLEQYTRWNKDRSAKIEIHIQNDLDTELCDSMADFGYQVVALDQHLADIFDISPVNAEELLLARQDALGCGDVVLWIGFDHDQNVVIAPSSLSLSNKGKDLGLLIYPEDVWEADECNSQSYNDETVQFFFDGWIKEQIAKNLAGELFEVQVYENRRRDECCIRGGFYTPEEALEEAQAEFPHIKYCANQVAVEAA